MTALSVGNSPAEKERCSHAEDIFKVEIIASLEEWKNLAHIWNDFLASSRADTIFLTWEWLFSWAECFLGQNRQLFILTVYRNHELVGIAPWYINRVSRYGMPLRQIEFLGSPETGGDYPDVILKRGKEQEITRILYRYLFHQACSHWDCLLLNDIPVDSLFLLFFQEEIEAEGKYAEIGRGSYCPMVNIPSGSEWFPPGCSSKRKARFHQDLNRLMKSGEVVHTIEHGPDLPDALNRFFDFYGEKTGYNNCELQFFLKKFAAYCSDLNRIRIDRLQVRGKTVAAFLNLIYREDVLLYLMAVDRKFNSKISAGNVLVGICLKQSHKEKRARYDFLKGVEPYKFYWADSGRTSVRIFLAKPSVSACVYFMMESLKRTAKMLWR